MGTCCEIAGLSIYELDIFFNALQKLLSTDTTKGSIQSCKMLKNLGKRLAKQLLMEKEVRLEIGYCFFVPVISYLCCLNFVLLKIVGMN